jgi:hypothetical protein
MNAVIKNAIYNDVRKIRVDFIRYNIREPVTQHCESRVFRRVVGQLFMVSYNLVCNSLKASLQAELAQRSVYSKSIYKTGTETNA